MSLNMNPQLLQTMVQYTALVTTKMFLTNMYSAFPKGLAGAQTPEDSLLWKTLFGVEKQTFDGEPASDAAKKKVHLARKRAERVVQNDLESIPISLIMLWTAAAVVKSDEAVATMGSLIKYFALARIGHSATYLLGIPGVRTACFAVGWSSVFQAAYLAVSSV